MSIISLEELQQIASERQGEELEIPGFTDTSVMTVKVRKISLLELVQEGVLPNPLLLAVNAIIKKQNDGEVWEGEQLERVSSTMGNFTEIVYKAALVEPTADTFISLGLELTQIQKRIIAEYSIGDVSTLERFRKFRADYENTMASQEVQQTT
ncbi:MAG: hypothetical protein ACRCR2_03735 [Fusobacteriaceae bacterium]